MRILKRIREDIARCRVDNALELVNMNMALLQERLMKIGLFPLKWPGIFIEHASRDFNENFKKNP